MENFTTKTSAKILEKIYSDLYTVCIYMFSVTFCGKFNMLKVNSGAGCMKGGQCYPKDSDFFRKL